MHNSKLRNAFTSPGQAEDLIAYDQNVTQLLFQIHEKACTHFVFSTFVTLLPLSYSESGDFEIVKAVIQNPICFALELRV